MPLVDLLVNLVFAGAVVGSIVALPVWSGWVGIRWIRSHRSAREGSR